jgi:hypothetical protein
MVKLLIVCLAAAATAEWFWWLVGGVAVAAVAWFAVRSYRAAAAELVADGLCAARVASRADEQHRQVLAGDDRGVYGVAFADVHEFERAAAKVHGTPSHRSPIALPA